MQLKKSSNLRALIVDDSDAILKLMSFALRSANGIEVIGSASNGAEAVARTEDLRPDVVIMDVEMPVMNGLEATRRIKRAHPSIIVLLVSGTENLLTDSLSAGADGYISKPFSTKSLIRRVKGNFETNDTH